MKKYNPYYLTCLVLWIAGLLTMFTGYFAIQQVTVWGFVLALAAVCGCSCLVVIEKHESHEK